MHARVFGAYSALRHVGLLKNASLMPAAREFALPVAGGVALGAGAGALAAGEGNRMHGALAGGAVGGVLGAGGKMLRHLTETPAAAETAAALAEKEHAAAAATLAQAHRSPTEKSIAARMGDDMYELDDVIRFNPADTYEQYVAKKARRDALLESKAPKPPTPAGAPPAAASPPVQSIQELNDALATAMLDKNYVHEI